MENKNEFKFASKSKYFWDVQITKKISIPQELNIERLSVVRKLTGIEHPLCHQNLKQEIVRPTYIFQKKKRNHNNTVWKTKGTYMDNSDLSIRPVPY